MIVGERYLTPLHSMKEAMQSISKRKDNQNKRIP